MTQQRVIAKLVAGVKILLCRCLMLHNIRSVFWTLSSSEDLIWLIHPRSCFEENLFVPSACSFTPIPFSAGWLRLAFPVTGASSEQHIEHEEVKLESSHSDWHYAQMLGNALVKNWVSQDERENPLGTYCSTVCRRVMQPVQKDKL